MTARDDVDNRDAGSPAEPESTDEAFALPEDLAAYAEGLRKDNAATRDELDKTLITLSTATLGVVLTLRQQIASAPGAGPIGFSPLFWGGAAFLFVCIGAVLVSHFVSISVNDRILTVIGKLTKWDGEAYEAVKDAQEKVRHVKRLNKLSALAFLIGLGCSVIYVISIAN
ncbi:hypothetical protein GO986_18800 [Deinococcus sp. HMF7620]|uniref:Uncharacterized protein n=1 Tax=Deinococcus arboris TaxID=2682977 RepID=A0A7C9HTS0_9DEIO|nr:hypothetical protein [Deinococcus arboris]MVN88792.1 hypothetical protein [Deinococcus arboris]